MNEQRIIQNTIIYLTDSKGREVGFGEGEYFIAHTLTGLGLTEISRTTTTNALMDGEIFIGNKIPNRIIEFTTEWKDARQREFLTDFLQHFETYQFRVLYDNRNYYGRCQLAEPYSYEDHNANLYSSSGVNIQLYFADPYLYTENIYSSSIGYTESANFRYFKTEELLKLPYMPFEEPFIYSEVLSEREREVVNPSAVSNGVQIKIEAFAIVVNPKIINLTTNRFIEFDVTLMPQDTMFINTQIGEIEASINGKDVLRYITFQSSMIQILSGTNMLLFAAKEGSSNARVTISFKGKVAAI